MYERKSAMTRGTLSACRIVSTHFVSSRALDPGSQPNQRLVQGVRGEKRGAAGGGSDWLGNCRSSRSATAGGARTFQSAAMFELRSGPETCETLEISGVAADWKVRAPAVWSAVTDRLLAGGISGLTKGAFLLGLVTNTRLCASTGMSGQPEKRTL